MPHAIVTGASSGIGAALARELSANGWHTTLVARRREQLEALAAELPGRCHVAAADLADLDQATAWLDGATTALGPVDLLINNAGAQVIGRTWQVDLERAEASLRLNLLVPLRLWHAVLPDMVARGQGTIVDICSMASLAPTPGMTWYNASKAGLAGASEALRGELKGTGVHVVTVYPGIIDETAMGRKGLEAYHQSAVVDLQPRGSTAGLARRVRQAVDQRRDRVIYPWVNTAARHFPGATRWVMDTFSPPVRDDGS